MTYRLLLAFALPLAVALPLSAAEWSSQARAEFVQQCVAGAPSGYDQGQLKAYCECAAEKVSREFSPAELKEMSRQTPPDSALRQRLITASSSCNDKLQ